MRGASPQAQTPLLFWGQMLFSFAFANAINAGAQVPGELVNARGFKEDELVGVPALCILHVFGSKGYIIATRTPACQSYQQQLLCPWAAMETSSAAVNAQQASSDGCLIPPAPVSQLTCDQGAAAGVPP